MKIISLDPRVNRSSINETEESVVLKKLDQFQQYFLNHLWDVVLINEETSYDKHLDYPDKLRLLYHTLLMNKPFHLIHQFLSNL